MSGRPRTEARLPDGALPDGTRPRVRGLNGWPEHLATLQRLDDRQDARGGELVTVADDIDLQVAAVLAACGLVTLHAGERGELLVGVTPGGDRALRRYGR